MEAAPGVVRGRILPLKARYHGGFGKIEKVQKKSWAEPLARSSGVNWPRCSEGFGQVLCLQGSRAGSEGVKGAWLFRVQTFMSRKVILRG